jgi:ATP-dependent helicase HrpA
MARLPLDPTLARMVLQARREHALREVLVIAAGLSVPDPRERPLNEEAKADAAHRRFLNPDSDFLTLLGIWETFHEDFERLSHARLRRFCKEHYLSFTRMREWIELHEQIARTLEGLGGFNLEQSAPEAGDNPRRFGGSFYRSVHRSLIPGLLANAARHEEGPWYRVAGDRKAMLFPGSGLFRRPESGGRGPQSREKPAAGKEKFPEWLVAAEVMETSRLYARTVARIDPQWLLELGASVIKISHSEPFFVEEGSRVVVKETARLHGLELRTRAVDFGRIDPVAAQEIFIREALVEGRITSPLPFLEHNRRIRDKVELMRTKLPGVALQDVDEAVYRFYRAALPPVSSVHDLNRVWKERVGREPEFLRLTEVALLGDLPTAVETAQFPDSLPLENSALPIEYAYKPGDEKDGVTLKVPVQRARLLDEGMLDWLVPAFLAEKIEHLIRALPKQHRVRLQPVAETSRRLASDLRPVPGGLAAALANHLETRFGIRLNEEERAALVLPQHLRTRVEVVDAQGRTIAAARALSEVQGGLANHERELARRPDAEIAAAWRAAATRLERVSHPGQGWIFGDLQECVEVTESAGVAVRAWLGLRRESVGVALRLFRSPQEAAAGLEDALEHLLADALRSELAYAEDDLRQINKLKLALVGFAPYDKVREQALICLRRHLCRRPVSPLTAERFSAVATAAKAEARGIAYKLVDRLQAVLEARTAAMGVKRPYREQAADIERLCPADLLGTTPFVQLQHVPRYLKAVVLRAEAAQMNPPADEERARQVRKAQEALAAWLKARGSSPETRKVAEDYRWMLEEFRVSLFAQKLGTAVPISLVRLERRLAEAAVGTG